MMRFLKHLFCGQRTKQLERWLLSEYEPAIDNYNESDRFDPLSHLLIDLGETYMGICYNEEIKKDFGVSEQEFNSISRRVYEQLVHSYSDSVEELDYPLYIRY